MARGRPWTCEEDDLLRELSRRSRRAPAPRGGWFPKAAARLGRTHGAVRARASRLGLGVSNPHLTQRAIAREAHCSRGANLAQHLYTALRQAHLPASARAVASAVREIGAPWRKREANGTIGKGTTG